MKKKNIFLILTLIASIFVLMTSVKAKGLTIEAEIYYGQTIHFIKGSLYNHVSCTYSGDLHLFEFTDTDYSFDHYVEVTDSNAKSGTVTATCSYKGKKAHNGGDVQVVDDSGTDTYIFYIKDFDENALSKFEVELHRQFYTYLDMKSYLTVKENNTATELVFSEGLAKIFGNNIPCNNQSCVVNLLQNAETGTHVGTVTYGNYKVEMTVHVNSEWYLAINTGDYGKCDLDGWKLNPYNDHFYQKTITSATTSLPGCSMDEENSDYAYKALKFLGWTYNRTSSNQNYNNYQSIDVCATFTDNTDPDVGFIKAGEVFEPAALKYNGQGNSVFYACYKRIGIGFNLLGSKLIDDDYGIQKWGFSSREEGVIYKVHYKVFDDGTKVMKLPSKVEPSGLNENEEFVGWINNRDAYSNIIPGGTEVSVEEGLIYTPYFAITKAETEKQLTVYVGEQFTVQLPDGFSCSNGTHVNYSLINDGKKCIVSGISSSGGKYLEHVLNNGGKTFTMKIQVIEGAYNGGQDLGDVEIGLGDLIIDPGDNSGTNAEIKVPADCNSYYVGKRTTGTVRSNPIFNYQHAESDQFKELTGQKIFTYYARSNCSSEVKFEIEYAALCIDPGRSGPTSDSYGTVATKDGGTAKAREYTFYKYIDVNDSSEQYAEFSKAVAHIVSKIGYMKLSEFNQPNNIDKIAANMALRIVTINLDMLSTEPDKSPESDITYIQAHMAYQSMNQHLGFTYLPSKGTGRIGKENANIKARLDEGETCETTNAAVIACDKEWTWLYSEFNGINELQDRIAEFLNYGANKDVLKKSWEQEPSISVANNDGRKITIDLLYPDTINFRYTDEGDPTTYGKYDISVNLSKEMAKHYQFELQHAGKDHLTCESWDGDRCLRYRVTLIDGTFITSGNLHLHHIYLNLTDDSDAAVFPEADSRDIYLEVGYTSTTTKKTAFMVEPANGSDSIQRMVLFNPERITKVYPLLISDCNKLLQNFGNNKEKYEAIYKAGCCETISDDSTEYEEFVKTYCKKDCVMNNYSPICVTGDTGKNYEIKEATTKTGYTNYACVVDVREAGLDVDDQIDMLNKVSVTSPDAFSNTSSMTDITGKNSIAINSFANNPYCRVTCKEDWKFDMPGYGDFLGDNAVKAGSLFQINHSINISSSVTCVTSYIDIEGYKEALDSLSTDIYNLYKEYSLRAAAHKDIMDNDPVVTNGEGYTWYTYDVSAAIPCGTSEFNYGSNGRASSSVVSNCKVEGNYTFKCKTTDDYKNHTSCRKGNSEQTHTATCDLEHIDESTCAAKGLKTLSSPVSCSEHGVDGCWCSEDPSGNLTVGCRTSLAKCTKDDVKNGVSGCSVDTSKTYSYKANTGTCTENTLGSGTCAINTDGTYSSACGLGDLTSSGFVTKKNSDGTTNAHTGCEIKGYYRNVDQTTYDSDANKCLIYKITSPETTSINLYNTSGSSDGTSSHSWINGLTHDNSVTSKYAQTWYKSGTSDKCNGDSECKINSDDVPSDYECETATVNRNNASHWREHLVKNHVVYNGDSTTLIRAKMVDIYKALIDKQEDMELVINAFGKCQNFYVNSSNVSNKPNKLFSGAAYISTIDTDTSKVLDGVTNTPYNIDTKFNPAGTFGYDEQDYMALLGNNRNIAPRGNVSVSTSSGMYNTSNILGFNTCYGSAGNYLNGETETACSTVLGEGSVEVNNYDFSYVNADNTTGYHGLDTYSKVLCKLGAVTDDSGAAAFNYDASDVCGRADYYYFNANYIKKTLSSSAAFDNYVTWYVHLPNGVASPGVGFESVAAKADAIDRITKKGVTVTKDVNNWSMMGTKNVFPVSLNTRRNIYQYYYSFKGIGNYYNGQYSSESERSGIGRIMGYDDSIIKSNSRVCFYEVYESACICCGDNALGPVSQYSNVVSKTYVTSNDKYSSYDKNGSGHYGFTTSPVSLYNLSGSGFSSNATNWSANEKYFYNGNGNYTTDKGKELADYIEGKGESIYAETPEYSYILTPNAMANIRALNDSAKYGYGNDTIYTDKTYTYLVYAEGKNHSVSDNETSRIIFTHFGSKFVRDKLSAYETPEYKGNLLSNKKMSLDCYVESASQLKDKKDCKWVDYLEPSGSGHFRMAFK